jgi:hypothetical protein
MRTSLQVLCSAATFAVSGHALKTDSLSFAEASAQHLITTIDGVLTPCPNVCEPGKFIWRDAETENDCTCRFEI